MKPADLLTAMAVCAVWAFNSLLSKVVVSDLNVPPLFYGMLRCLIIALCVLPWLLPLPRQWLRLIAASFLIGGGSFAVYFAGLRYTTASNAAIVSQIGLPITTILSVLMLGEVIRWRRALGILLSFLGTLLVVWHPGGMEVSRGLLLIVLSAAASSLGAILMKQVQGVRPIQFQAWAGTSAILPLTLASALLETGQWAGLRNGGWVFAGCLAFSAIIVSVLAHTAYYRLIARYEANLVAPLMLMSPVFTVLLGVALMGDRLGLNGIAGALLTLVGVLIIAVRPNRVMPRVLLVRER